MGPPDANAAAFACGYATDPRVFSPASGDSRSPALELVLPLRLQDRLIACCDFDSCRDTPAFHGGTRTHARDTGLIRGPSRWKMPTLTRSAPNRAPPPADLSTARNSRQLLPCGARRSSLASTRGGLLPSRELGAATSTFFCPNGKGRLLSP